jgi:endonuclease/exonuclease/phosphatase family metal-dependent hydrolase
MNDEEMQDVTVVAIEEPHARRMQGRLLTTPMLHHKWTKMVPSTWREGRWPIRSMLWVSREVEAEQVRIESPNLTAAIIRLHERQVLVVSVYIPGGDTQALRETCNKLDEAITDVRRRASTVVDVVLAGDFNQHDQLWRGEDVTMVRQGEADPIIDLMIEHGLSSLLPHGIKTWQGGDYETTIDLVLASKELADTVTRCAIYTTEHGSDHRTIETVFERHRIKARDTDQCDCGQAAETVEHFLFRCRRWTAQRTEMLQCTQTGRGNMSLYLGGKAATDDAKWAPDMDAVRATIRFALATGRLDAN